VAGLTVAFLVTLFELGCTGQVYVPTLLLIAREGHSSAAWFYLLIYNFLFVLPLIAIFSAAYFGVSASGLARLFRERVALVKILLTVLFLALGALLISRVFI
jgi:hypothetical protein